MLCYIKDMKTFQTLSKFDTTEYSLAEGENGQVTIYQKNAIELTTKYVGMWLIINKELYYISGATPDNDSIDLIIQEPIYAFSRQVEYDGSTTYGTLLKNIIDDNFGVNCPDSEYKLSYLSSINTDSTACNIETDDYGYIVPYQIFDDAMYYGVKIDFNFTNTNLEIAISTANYSTGSVVFDDGSTTLESESYDANFIAKVTVIHDLGQSEPEEGEEPEDQYEVIDFYLSSDNHISTEPPPNRAKGIWKYYTAAQDESPMAVAIGAFSHNNDNHKIEFRSLKRFALYQSIKMRLRNDVFNTIITSRVYSTGDDRYYYKCGNLAVTLTEKIDSGSDENAEEIKHIKNRIANMNGGGGGGSSGVSSVNGRIGHVLLTKSDVSLSNVDNVQQYSETNPPPYPVTSVNGQTGAVNIPSGAGSGIAVQDNPPTNGELVWIDTDDPGAQHIIPEIDDDHVSLYDTWSSQKIASQSDMETLSLSWSLLNCSGIIGGTPDVKLSKDGKYLWFSGKRITITSYSRGSGGNPGIKAATDFRPSEKIVVYCGVRIDNTTFRPEAVYVQLNTDGELDIRVNETYTNAASTPLHLIMTSCIIPLN